MVAQGVVADCDADFFSAGVLAGDILRVVFSGHAASIGEGGQSSGALRIELSRGDESIPVEAAEGEGEGAIAVITPDDDGVTNRIEIDVPAAAEDGEVTIGVIKDSYADNLFPVSDAYDLHASP